MFLLIGAGPHTKQIGDSQMMICPSCGRFSRMTPYVRRQEIRLFFLPVARFRRQYYAKASCCGEIFQLDPEVGRSIERGEPVTIDESDLTFTGTPQQFCAACQRPVEPSHTYCPHCGEEL